MQSPSTKPARKPAKNDANVGGRVKPKMPESGTEAEPGATGTAVPSAAPRNLTEAKMRVMVAVSYIRKRGTMSGGGGYKFVRDCDVVGALKPVMIDNLLVLSGPSKISDLARDTIATRNGQLNRTSAVYTFALKFMPTGETEDVVVIGEGSDSLDKSSNKSMSAARKYALTLAFSIVTGDDPDAFDADGNAAADTEPEPGEGREPPAKAAPAQARTTPAPAAAKAAEKPATKPAGTNGQAHTNGKPANGKELYNRLADYDTKLSGQKLCVKGALLAAVTSDGVKAGYGADMTSWSGPAIDFAIESTKTFEAGLKTAGKAEAPPAAEPSGQPTPAEAPPVAAVKPDAAAVAAADALFAKRIAGMNGCKSIENLDKFRDLYSKDATMSKDQKTDLEKCYWANHKRLGGKPAK